MVFNGIPTLENEPAINWITDEDKNNHLGDLYYNQDNGAAYRFVLDNNVYRWNEVNDTELAMVLAIANKAQDTADSKRRVFIDTPTPPYDCGDLWIKDRELYRCQTSKEETETFEANDWINSLKYTDDTYATQVGKNLTILSGTVTEIQEGVNSLKNTMTSTTELINEQGETLGILEEKISSTNQTVDNITSTVSSVATIINNEYTNTAELNKLLEDQKQILYQSLITNIEQSTSDIEFNVISKITSDGITTLKNTMVTIDENGINTSKSDDDVVSLLNNLGLYVSDGKLKDDNSNLLMRTDRSGAYFKIIEIKNTIKEHDLIQKESMIDDKYGKCQAWFWIGGDS